MLIIPLFLAACSTSPQPLALTNVSSEVPVFASFKGFLSPQPDSQSCALAAAGNPYRNTLLIDAGPPEFRLDRSLRVLAMGAGVFGADPPSGCVDVQPHLLREWEAVSPRIIRCAPVSIYFEYKSLPPTIYGHPVRSMQLVVGVSSFTDKIGSPLGYDLAHIGFVSLYAAFDGSSSMALLNTLRDRYGAPLCARDDCSWGTTGADLHFYKGTEDPRLRYTLSAPWCSGGSWE